VCVIEDILSEFRREQEADASVDCSDMWKIWDSVTAEFRGQQEADPRVDPGLFSLAVCLALPFYVPSACVHCNTRLGKRLAW
jgi:hypothetical protein